MNRKLLIILAPRDGFELPTNGSAARVGAQRPLPSITHLSWIQSIMAWVRVVRWPH